MKAKNIWNFRSSPVHAEWISLCELFTGQFYILPCIALTRLCRIGNSLPFPRGEILLEPTQQHAYISYQSFIIWLCTCLN